MNNLKSISWLSVLSITILLLFFGLFFTISFHSNKIVETVKENVNVIVELDHYISDSIQESILEKLKLEKRIRIESIELLNESSALEYMKDELSTDLVMDSNPFNKVIKFNMNKESLGESHLQSLKQKYGHHQDIVGIYSGDIPSGGSLSNVKRFSVVSLMLSSLFSLLALVLLYNGIKMTLMKDEKKIRTMQLVGADNKFIMLPYLKDAFYLGVLGFVGFFVVMIFLMYFTPFVLPALTQFLNIGYVLLMFCLVFILALSITMISTYIIIKLYLRKNYNIYQ